MTIVFDTRSEEVEYAKEVICNRCGKNTNWQGLNFQHTWGYESNHDLEKWTGDLCEECSEEFEKWISPGKIDKMICMVDGTPLMTKEEYDVALTTGVGSLKGD